jgi:hypothetical protein
MLRNFKTSICDFQGTKIPASISWNLAFLFDEKIIEENVYEMSRFKTEYNASDAMATYHIFICLIKLVFLIKTLVAPAESFLIPTLGLSIISAQNVYSFLIGGLIDVNLFFLLLCYSFICMS